MTLLSPFKPLALSVRGDIMSFKYINPGYAELLATYNSDSPIITVESNIYNPVNGVCVNQSGSYSNVLLDEVIGSDLYCKFNFYYTSSMKDLGVGSFVDNKENNFSASWFYGLYSYNDGYLYFYLNNSSKINIALTKDLLHKVWFHIHNVAGSAYIEAYIDGQYFSYANSYANNAFNTKIPAIVVRLCSSIFLSNLIFSNEYINPKEEVIILPTSATETDMTDNQDGTYTASEAGQTILQTVNATDLITQYGRNSRITIIAPAAIPAYNTTGALKLLGIDKISGTITEHDTIAVGTNDSVGVYDLWNTNNLTLGDLNGKQIGWKAVL